MRLGKVIVGGVSIILVVGVCIGLIAGLSQRHGSGKDDSDVLSSTSKSVTAICGQTDYKQQCINSVSSVSNNQSATPIDFIKAAIDYTVQHVQMAMNNTDSIMKDVTNNATMKMAADDCKDLLQFAIDELQACFSLVGDSSLHTLQDREDELKNWLSAVMSYTQTCLDGFSGSELMDKITNHLQNPTQLTSNALAIVSAITNILNDWGITLDPQSSASSRRLMEADENGENGYLRWMAAGDRKLLASNRHAQATPNAIVAKDGSGHFTTISAALASYPKNHRGRYIIYVKAGIYKEYVTVTKDQVNIYMYGDGPRKTMVTGNKSFKDGITTFKTSTFSVIGDGFMARSMGFQNTAGAIGHQAVALRVQADRAAFYNCRMDGYQDTLYQQAHRQFYRNCVISGTVDFIFGDSSSVIQNSLIIVRTPMDGQENTVTAQGRADRRESTGLVIQNCRIVPEEKLFPVAAKYPSYLGRPWKQYSRTIIMESTIGGFIQPAGWLPWSGSLYLDTLYYAEYGNRGPGANTKGRVRWKGVHVLPNRNQVMQFTAGLFIQGGQWLSSTGFPNFLSLKYP